MTDPQQHEAWERKAIEKVLMSLLKEQRRSRNWGIFFKILMFVWIFSLVALAAGWIGGKSDDLALGPHTAVVNLNGVIDSSGEARADNVIKGLRDAFKDGNTRAVILRANSPGGSPVQSAVMYDEILRLRKLYPRIPVYTVVEDVCASGCYYAAAASDKIFVNRGSLIGSIGVLMDGFGFTGSMQKLGIERRLLTAGENKGFLDPFSPMNAQQESYAKQMLAEIHQQFIDAVKQGRGKRLKNDPQLFSGLVWNGARGVELGLADDYGSVESVARDVIKAEKVLDYSIKDNIAERFAKRLGAGAMMGFWNGFGESLGTRLR